ncbi:Multidrug resistance protein MdtH [Candidatus Lokiarchaeum ossiferum]|uniref:Multidrug resistance protein MdtH n=1 Tax=Candidatus Lokiarchaeum ossiferum TaxID=2951803 RepID=A0ABY6HUG8_9ARCH|nr:Multidrug resistance protein MdtH [Candidatus Lokiarchaeum sp. B-35]
MFSKLKKISQEFPNTFWVLTLSTFIDRMGGFMLFPFFSIYLMEHFSASFTQVGLLFMMMSIGNILGSVIGGAVTDKIGRKKIIIFGLVASGLGSILMGLVNQLEIFYILASLLGILGSIGHPARQAMVPDLLLPEQHSQAYAILRVAVNISATVGPILGGFIALHSYMALFIIDAASSIITAIIVAFIIPETKRPVSIEAESQSFSETLKGYFTVMKDRVFMSYLFISAIMILVYMQMYSTLSVYLVAEQGFTNQMIGLLMSVNAALVVTTQFLITRKISKMPLLKAMALGTLCYGIGFGMFGIVNSVYFVFIAMIFVTLGEMIALPTSQGVVAKFAPEDKRGRYMAVFSFSWTIPNLFGTLLAGNIMDKYNPNWVWYGCVILSAIAIGGFLLLHRSNKDRFVDEIVTDVVEPVDDVRSIKAKAEIKN